MRGDRLLFGMTLIGCLAASGCTVKAPSQSGRDSIEQVLQESIRNNEKMARSGRLKSSVERALTPELEISLGKTRKQVSNAPRFDVVVNNVPARDFFAGLVKDTEYNIVVDPEIKGFITLNLRQVTVPQVMEAVRDGYGYEYEETAYGFRIYPNRLETKVFRINYIDVSRKGSSYTTLSSSQQITPVGSAGGSSSGGGSGSKDTMVGAGGSINTENDGKFWEVLKQNLDALIDANKDKGSVVVINPKAGTVIARAYPGELRAIARYLDKVQSVIQRQVIIEAKIIEVELEASFHSGIDWKLFGFKQNQPAGDAWAFSSASITATSASHGNPFQAAINLLNHQGSVNVLSSPRIATLNNQKAVIKVGTDRFYVTDLGSDTNSGGGSSVTSTSMTLTPFFSGISLDVTPQIDDEENVTIHIHPIISTISDDDRKFKTNGQEQQLPLARSEVRESDTVVRAKNGQVIVIGGLMKSEGRSLEDSIPGIDKVPAINGAFKSTSRKSGKSELVILLRPIIASDVNWQKQLKEAAISINKMEADGEYKYELQSAKAAAKAR